jgi:hypothetical protein
MTGFDYRYGDFFCTLRRLERLWDPLSLLHSTSRYPFQRSNIGRSFLFIVVVVVPVGEVRLSL